MIERIVLLKLRDEFANPDGRARVAAELEVRLHSGEALLGAKIGLPADEPSACSWDLVITFGFDPSTLAPGGAPEAELLSPLGDRVLLHKAWSFERL